MGRDKFVKVGEPLAAEISAGGAPPRPSGRPIALDDCHPLFAHGVRAVVALHRLKSADYGDKKDVFANCRASERFGVPGWVGTLIRAVDKVQRLQSLHCTGSLANENATDSFVDAANYFLIALSLWLEDQPSSVREEFEKWVDDLDYNAEKPCGPEAS